MITSWFALVAAVRHHRRAPALPLDAGLGVGAGVVAIAGQRLADHHGQAGVGVDDDLQVGRVAVVLRAGRQIAVVGGYQRAVHDQHRVARVLALDLRQHQVSGQVLHDAPGRRFGDPEQQRDLSQRQVRTVVDGH